jgi:putative ABC transport system ATP-binding protein
VGVEKSLPQGGGRVEILRGIDLEVPRGQAVAILGPSGSGKSTLLGLIAGLDTPSGGQVVLEGTDISRMEEDQLAQLRGQKIGFVFQSYNLIPTLTAEENVALPLELANGAAGALDRARDLLRQVGLEQRRSHYPIQLSGGEQQRVALARAFVTRPAILLADEPTGNLDSQTGKLVLELLVDLHRREGTTLLLVTHDPTLAAAAERLIHLRDGRIVSDELRDPMVSSESPPHLDPLPGGEGT